MDGTGKGYFHLPMPKTAPMLILGDPSLAFKQSFLPNRGVGTAAHGISDHAPHSVHPLALTRFEQITDAGGPQEISRLYPALPRQKGLFRG
jgi:pyruvate,water dikinase